MPDETSNSNNSSNYSVQYFISQQKEYLLEDPNLLGISAPLTPVISSSFFSPLSNWEKLQKWCMEKAPAKNLDWAFLEKAFEQKNNGDLRTLIERAFHFKNANFAVDLLNILLNEQPMMYNVFFNVCIPEPKKFGFLLACIDIGHPTYFCLPCNSSIPINPIFYILKECIKNSDKISLMLLRKIIVFRPHLLRIRHANSTILTELLHSDILKKDLAFLSLLQELIYFSYLVDPNLLDHVVLDAVLETFQYLPKDQFEKLLSYFPNPSFYIRIFCNLIEDSQKSTDKFYELVVTLPKKFQADELTVLHRAIMCKNLPAIEYLFKYHPLLAEIPTAINQFYPLHLILFTLSVKDLKRFYKIDFSVKDIYANTPIHYIDKFKLQPFMPFLESHRNLASQYNESESIQSNLNLKEVSFNLTHLPHDILLLIFGLLPNSTLFNISILSKKFKTILSDENFWKFLLSRDFPNFKKKEYDNLPFNYKEHYRNFTNGFAYLRKKYLDQRQKLESSNRILQLGPNNILQIYWKDPTNFKEFLTKANDKISTTALADLMQCAILNQEKDFVVTVLSFMQDKYALCFQINFFMYLYNHHFDIFRKILEWGYPKYFDNKSNFYHPVFFVAQHMTTEALEATIIFQPDCLLAENDDKQNILQVVLANCCNSENKSLNLFLPKLMHYYFIKNRNLLTFDVLFDLIKMNNNYLPEILTSSLIYFPSKLFLCNMTYGNSEKQREGNFLHAAITFKNYAAIKYLVGHYPELIVRPTKTARQYPIHSIIMSRLLDNVFPFFNENLNFNVQDKDGNTPVHYILQEPIVEYFPYLENPTINWLIQNNKQVTPLHALANNSVKGNGTKKSYKTLIKSLMKFWTEDNLNLKDKADKTIIDTALNKKNTEFICFIIKLGLGQSISKEKLIRYYDKADYEYKLIRAKQGIEKLKPHQNNNNERDTQYRMIP